MYTFALPKNDFLLGGMIVEERLEALQEPWTSFVIEFPTYPKQMVHGRDESQRILFLCPQVEANPTELCLALFGSQILMHRLQQGESTEAIASASVQEKIRQIIESENPKKPYSDSKISELLKEANINIARRTVAKYREMMKVLPSSKRKQF